MIPLYEVLRLVKFIETGNGWLLRARRRSLSLMDMAFQLGRMEEFWRG